jgi:hypothetical protein
MSWLFACGSPCPCDRIDLPKDPVRTEAGLRDLLDAVRAAAWPEYADLSVGVAPVDGLAYFRAWTELDTVGLDDGRARAYTVQYDPVVLEDPPEPAAVAALLTHEMGHVDDYVGMDSAELVSFALWYGTQDPLTSDELADYERATDEKALERGCADGLAAARQWIYAHADPETLAEKKHNYDTPAQIDAWTDDHGACSE